MSLRAFMIADIRGYTKYTQDHGDEAGARMTSRFTEIVQDGVKAEGGRIIDKRGDEVLAEFESPRGAIRAAVKIQSRLLEATLAQPEIPLAAGIGLDVGEGVDVEGGQRGGAINLAARLCSQAGPGEILSTPELVHLARALEGIEYLGQAAVRLKGMDEPVAAVKVSGEVDPAGLWAAMPQGSKTEGQPKKGARKETTSSGSKKLLLVGAGIAALVVAAFFLWPGDKEESGDEPRITAVGGPQVGECPVFPPDNPWNQRVDDLPLHPDSDRLIASIGRNEDLHPDFGPEYRGDEIGIVVNRVDEEVPLVDVAFRYAEESDEGPYPISNDTEIEDSRDHHAIIVDETSCTLYELFGVSGSGSTWEADTGAIWDLTSNDLRPIGWTSADAAGLPIFPGLARYSEVEEGEITHALRFTAEATREAFIYPARHEASDSDAPDLPPMGLRVRLRADFPIDDFPPQSRVILVALQRYGMMLADNGGNWFITGEPSEQWILEDLDALKDVTGADFEVVDSSSLELPD
jgi:class 3 adenylate cyclase